MKTKQLSIAALALAAALTACNSGSNNNQDNCDYRIHFELTPPKLVF